VPRKQRAVEGEHSFERVVAHVRDLQSAGEEVRAAAENLDRARAEGGAPEILAAARFRCAEARYWEARCHFAEHELEHERNVASRRADQLLPVLEARWRRARGTPTARAGRKRRWADEDKHLRPLALDMERRGLSKPAIAARLAGTSVQLSTGDVVTVERVGPRRVKKLLAK
jgi:hypothetical protein